MDGPRDLVHKLVIGGKFKYFSFEFSHFNFSPLTL